MSKLLSILLIFMAIPQLSFRQTQLKFARVKTAYDQKEVVVKKYFEQIKEDYTSFSLFIRVFKKEKKVEAWVKDRDKDSFVLLHTYDFCATSGSLGPKRKEGDLQIPEGVYQIDHFNPLSNFYLSLGISYPNSSDRILSDKQHPGGSIYIHGNCVTVGCIPLTDDKIKELYVLAVEAKNSGQDKIVVHIFPSRLDAHSMEALSREFQQSPVTTVFWKNLQSVYQDFETSRKLKTVKVNSKGEYHF